MITVGQLKEILNQLPEQRKIRLWVEGMEVDLTNVEHIECQKFLGARMVQDDKVVLKGQ